MQQGKKIDYKKETVLEAIKNSHGIILSVANNLKCNWATARTYINNWKETKQALEDEKETFGDFVESKAMECVQNNSEQMIRFYLTTLFKDRGFTEKKELEHTGKDGGPIQSENVDKLEKIIENMSDEDRKTFFEIYERSNGIK